MDDIPEGLIVANIDHPNDAGRWTCIEAGVTAALWKREHLSFPPLVQFYVVNPPLQHEILYEEEKARRVFESRLGLAVTPSGT